MQARWQVTYGPEFEESKKACKMSPKRLKLHLTGIELSLERDPFLYSEAYGDELHRVIDTRDYFRDEGGVVLSAFVVLNRSVFVAEIKWIDVGPLPSGEDDDEDEDEDEDEE
jgi:hypothetical protein